MLLGAITFAACEPKNPPTTNPNDGKDSTTVIPSDSTQSQPTQQPLLVLKQELTILRARFL
jgi:hypothetical protein